MILGWLKHQWEFTSVPSHGSVFVYLIPSQNVMPVRVTPAWVHPGCCTGARITLWYEISQWYHFTMVSCICFSVKSVYWWTGMGSFCVMFVILNRTCILSTWSTYLQITKIWNDPSSCKCNTKSHSHPSMKLVLVWVFPCKHPLSKDFTDCFCDLCILLLCINFVQGLNKTPV